MKQSFLSLLWAAIMAVIIYLLIGNILVAVGAFFIVLHISFFSLSMSYCEDYRDKFLDALAAVAPIIVLGGLGIILIVAVFVAFFVASPLFFVIKGKDEVY